MKIAILSPSIYMSPTRYGDMIFAPRDLSIALVDGLVDRGHDVFFFTTPDVPTKAKLISGDLDLLDHDYIKSMLGETKSERLHWGYFSTMKHDYEMDLTTKCYKQAVSEKFDIVHSYHERLAHFLDDLTGVPTVYTLHDPLPDKKINLIYWLLNKFARHNYVSITNSFRRSDILDLNFVDTVYHGIDVSSYTYSEVPGKYLAFMARLIPQKGADDAIKAAKETQMQLKIATSQLPVNISNDQYYASTIAPLLTQAEVTFTGFMDRQQKSDYLSQAKAFLFPIKWEEPFGMVMIEAMACGTPVIAYNRGSVSEIVRDGVTGFIVNEDLSHLGNLSNLSNLKIKQTGVAGLVEAVKRIGEIDRAACRRHVEENFTVEKMVSGYEAVYRKWWGDRGPNG